jgi:CxxC-x17-CxxC domain-containing protein
VVLLLRPLSGLDLTFARDFGYGCKGDCLVWLAPLIAQRSLPALSMPELKEMEDMTYAERTLTCTQCGNGFVFSVEDQEFHAGRGYQDPKRCPSCRAERRASQGGGYGGGSSYGGGGGGGSYDRPQRQMYSATCAQCGKEAMVPFEPRGDKPVYCSDCYKPAPRSSSW